MKNMKNLSKRGLALLLALIMCLGMVNLTAFAAEGEPDVSGYTCGLVEHEHTDTCYVSQPPLCGLEETPDASEQPSEDAEAPEETPEAPEETPEVPEETPEVPEETPEVPEQTPEVPEQTPEVPEQTPEVPEQTPEVPEQTPEVPAETQPVPDPEPETAQDAPAPEVDRIDDGGDALSRRFKNEGEGDDGAAVAGHTHTEACYISETPLCGLEEHTHALTDCTVFPQLAAGMEEFGPKAMEFYMDFCANNPDLLDEYEELTEEGMSALAVAVPAELAELCNNLVTLYKQIPVRFAGDPVYDETVATLANLAGMLGGDLDSGIMTLDGNRTLTFITTGDVEEDWSDRSVATVWSGTLVVNGTWHGTIVKKGDNAVTIKGNGTIDARDSGSSAITIESGTVILKDGVTITGGTGTAYNESNVSSGNETSGGGVIVESGTFTMEGGTITGNSASRGGGIYVARGAFLNIYGGSISGNEATGVTRSGGAGNFGGGGIWINGTAVIDPTQGSDINIQNNTSLAEKDLGGGAIYVNSNYGKLTLVNAVITNNTAAGLGGGIATCMHGKIAEANIEGAAIYGNRINPDTTVTTASGSTDASETWTKSDYQEFRKAAVDILSAGVNDGNPDHDDQWGNFGGTIISDKQLGGGLHGWTGYTISGKDGVLAEVAPGNNGMIYSGYAMALTATNATPGTISENKVTISGNTSAAHGGGIACNGILLLSVETPNIETWALHGVEPLSFSKTLDGASIADNQFTFQLLASDRETVLDEQKNVGGTVALSYADGIDQTKQIADTYTFYVRELDDSNTEPNQTLYKVVVTTEFSHDTEGEVATEHGVNGKKQTLTTHHYTVVSTTITKVRDKDGTAENEPVTSPAFENTWKTGSLTINKSVVSPTTLAPDELFIFRVTLEDKDNLGITFDNAEELGFTKIGNVWKKDVEIAGNAFEDNAASVTITGIPYGLIYTVEETSVDKWNVTGNNASGTIDDSSSVSITDTRKTVDLSVQKSVTWNEDQSEDPKDLTSQAFTVVVTLSNSGKTGGGGTNVTTFNGDGRYTFTLNPGNGNGVEGTAATITGIPTGTLYTVVETRDGMSTGYTYKSGDVTTATELNVPETVTIENHYFNSKTTSLTVHKVWSDAGHENTRPASIQVQLYDDGTASGEPVTLDADNNWSYTWESLPKDGHVWKVGEVNVPDGYTATQVTAGSEVTITNTYNAPKTTSLTVNKVWSDGADTHVNGSVTVNVLTGGEIVQSVVLNAANNWTATVEGLDIDKSYKVEEVAVSGYTPAYTTNEDGSITITNTRVPTTPTPDPTPTPTPTPDPDPTPTPTPDPDPEPEPEEPVDEPDVPLAEEPEELDEPDVPLANLPEEPEEEIPDEDVPLANAPKTGDDLGLWLTAGAMAAMGLAVVLGKRKEDEEA